MSTEPDVEVEAAEHADQTGDAADLEQLSPEELAALAGQAVGVEPVAWDIQWTSVDGKVASARFDDLESGRHVIAVKGGDVEGVAPVYPLFSCARLKRAALEAGAELQITSTKAECWVRLFVGDDGFEGVAATEERAVTLAIACWGVKTGKVAP